MKIYPFCQINIFFTINKKISLFTLVKGFKAIVFFIKYRHSICHYGINNIINHDYMLGHRIWQKFENSIICKILLIRAVLEEIEHSVCRLYTLTWYRINYSCALQQVDIC